MARESAGKPAAPIRTAILRHDRLVLPRRPHGRDRAARQVPASTALTLPVELVRRAVTEAERTGGTPEDVVTEALDRYLAGADER